MTTITPELSPNAITPIYVVRSTDLQRAEGFRELSSAIRFCRQIGLPYHVNSNPKG
jgi:hypothetical protein